MANFKLCRQIQKDVNFSCHKHGTKKKQGRSEGGPGVSVPPLCKPF